MSTMTLFSYISIPYSHCLQDHPHRIENRSQPTLSKNLDTADTLQVLHEFQALAEFWLEIEEIITIRWSVSLDL